MINYRSIVQLNDVICKNISKFSGYDLIVGIPRSGLLVANIIALQLNVLISDIESFINNRVLYSGISFKLTDKERNCFLDIPRKVLIVDDSVGDGTEKKFWREKLVNCKHKLTWAAIYYFGKVPDVLDFVIEEVAPTRFFEWNWKKHDILSHACIDLDGVFCLDPTNEQNDDGENYINFVNNASVIFRPKVKLYHIVTSRLEKYRTLTEKWLHLNGIAYEKLTMMNVNTPAERSAIGHANFKAEIYSKDERAEIFIESSESQSKQIFSLTKKPVFSVETRNLYQCIKK